MAREITIFADTVNQQLSVADISDGINNVSIGGGFGLWYYTVEGNITDLADPLCSVKLWIDGKSTGAFVFADIAACDIDGVNVKNAATINQLYMAYVVAQMGGTFFRQPSTLPEGAANSSLQAEIRLLMTPPAVREINGTGIFIGDQYVVHRANTITLGYALTDTDTGDLNTVALEGSLDGSNWFTLASVVGVGDSVGNLGYKVSTAGIAVFYARVSVDIIGSGGATTTIASVLIPTM